MGDTETYHRLHDAQDAEGRRATTAVSVIAFTNAVKRRFGGHPSPEDIIDFVADARIRTVGPDSAPPEDAERVIRAALDGESLRASMGTRRLAAAQTFMLFAITHETDEAPAQIDELLAEAAEEAEAYFERRAAR
jgi:hypothetical protein